MTPTRTPRTCLLTLKTYFGFFSSFRPGFYNFISFPSCLGYFSSTHPQPGQKYSCRLVSSTNVPGSHLPARRTCDRTIVLNRKERIQGLLLEASSIAQLMVKSSFTLPDPIRGKDSPWQGGRSVEERSLPEPLCFVLCGYNCYIVLSFQLS